MRRILFAAMLLLLAPPAVAQQSEGDAIKGQSMMLLARQDLDKLNALADKYRGEKTADGRSKLDLMYAGFDMLPMSQGVMREREWPAMLGFAQNWVDKKPSQVAVMALAKMHIRYAWERRGADGRPSVQDQKAFAEHIAKARQVLMQGRAIASADPEWMQTLVQITRAEQPMAVSVPGASPPMTVARYVEDPQDELSAMANVEMKARLLFERRKFVELNALAQDFRVKGSKTPAGYDHLNLLYSGISQYVEQQTPKLTDRPNEAQWRKMFAHAQEWIDKAPSPAAYITMAKLRSQYAHDWRGDGFAPQVKPEHWKPFYENMKIAADVLGRHKQDASIDPEWYVEMATQSRNRQAKAQDASALYIEAMERHPYYFPIYQAIAIELSVNWGGSWKAVDSFTNLAAVRTKDKMGMSYYTRIYQSLNCICDAVEDSLRDWKKMQRRFEDILARWPVQWNLNRYAFYACQARDRKTTKSIIEKIVHPRAGAWANNNDLYLGCKAWASGGGFPADLKVIKPF